MRCESHGLSAPLARLADVLSPLRGQCIALIAPAGGVTAERIDATLAVLEAAGIDARLGAHARDHHRYLAGPAETRLADLHAAFELPEVTAVWCLRGGYGSAHLVENIDWSRIPSHVPLIGFSDITALLEAFRQRRRFAIHGPVATQLATPGETVQEQNQRAASMASLVDLLLGRTCAWPLTHMAGPISPVAGQVIGGNLTTLASLAGTPAALRLQADSILLLEDVGEAEFRLERSFQQLIASIELDRLNAVCLGGFDDCALANGIPSLAAIFAEWIPALPLYAGLPVSHGYENLVWRCGSRASTEADRIELEAPPAAITSG